MAEPLCPYFYKCGGCSSQHIDYPVQLENKKKALADAINFNDINVFSGKEYYYRNRMDMLFHPRGIGFRKKKKGHEIVDVCGCIISNEKLNTLIKELRNFFREIDSFNVKKQTGTFRYAVIRATSKNSSVSFVLNEDSTRLADAVDKIKEFAGKTTANNVVVTYVPSKIDESTSNEFFVVKGSDMLKEKYLGMEFIFSVQGFFQNNHELAEKMHEYCRNLLKSYETKEASLLDLYGGVGTLGIVNADLFKGATIIENNEQSIEAAKINTLENNIKNAEAVMLDAKNLKKIKLPHPLFAITDPPRTGMDQKTIQELNNLKPKVIIYISCNVSQLKKEVIKLKGYEIKSAALFDFFPQTQHSEAVVELVCK